MKMYVTAGADPGFWFGRGTGRGSEGRKSPSGGLGAMPPEARRMLRHEAKKQLTEIKKTSPHRLYYNIIIIIISSTHHFMFPAIFVLKYKTQSAGSEPAKWSTMA